MRMTDLKAIVKATVLGATVLLLGLGMARAQVSLVAAPTTVTLPDGSVVPMWGYSCVSALGATCTALNPASATSGKWSPVLITVPYTGTSTSLTINLTNLLSFPTSGTTIPTSVMIVGQVGGGLGSVTSSCVSTSSSTTGSTCTPSPDHSTPQQVTWPVASTGATNVPPPQGPRVRYRGDSRLYRIRRAARDLRYQTD